MMRCTECGTTEDVMDRVYLVNRGDVGGPCEELGPLRLCEACWERRRAAFRRQVETAWRANVATVKPREGRRLGGDTGMRL